ncbi:YaaC family protein [Evansella cellulosilytica]|uniref:YaaC-like Protein n=1 Tax=Evansella cellulosilytica (strain ATCC 21833 / DSM 2522 / FERM P-1141 / JCM 9156 / N-4) TaxID=649639 RepID=E6TRK8_EVAC2|nr:YaaC family protein [Evansella cellulosilytica]ADU28302.1 hypothetical protein Bcell_0010 [Evansella cellulosilytica DSM 2522]
MYNDISFITLFKSVEYVKKYLYERYKEAGFSSPKELAFQNSYSFVYYIELGQSYFEQGKKAPLSIKPVLFFYGLSHWLKGALLTIDPNYPATTQVLAHGVSTRKRKKQGYRFLTDEIKIQKEGFYPYVSKSLFNIKELTGEKYKMRHLIMSIPELAFLIEKFEGESILIQVNKVQNKVYAPLSLLKKMKITPRRFELMIKEKTNTIVQCIEKEENLIISYSGNNDKNNFPLYYNLNDKKYYLPSVPHLYLKIPEILSHFLLLYNLSMICRYETEWWGELLYSFSSNDRPYIQSFLDCTERKTPYLMESLFKAK